MLIRPLPEPVLKFKSSPGTNPGQVFIGTQCYPANSLEANRGDKAGNLNPNGLLLRFLNDLPLRALPEPPFGFYRLANQAEFLDGVFADMGD